jgi:flagellar biosynthesis/type III secretory pathway M-ring protein FliF/YscJ
LQAISLAALKSGEGQLTSDNAHMALPGGRQPEEVDAAASPGATAGFPAAESKAPAGTMSSGAAGDEQIERELMEEANAVELGGRKFAAIKKKLVEKANKDPEMVSQLIRTLLREKA